MGKWKGPWECKIHGVIEYGLVDVDTEGKHIHAVGPYGLCREPLIPHDRRAPDPRLAALVGALERIAWHELTWKEARDIARAALAAIKEEA